MSNREKEEERAKAWLRDRGYATERPTWLPDGSLKPDFWAECERLKPARLWAEVKSVDEDDSTAVLAKFHHLVSSANIPSDLNGHAHITIEPHAVEQSIRWALRFFALKSPAYVGKKIVLAFVQQSSDGDDIQRVEIGGPKPTVVWVHGAGEKKLRAPTGVCDEYHSPAKLIDNDHSERVGKVSQFFNWTGKIECALVLDLDRAEQPLTLISPMSSGSGDARERTVRALEDANRQIKEACAIRLAPGVVFLVPRGPFSDDFSIQDAAYGVSTVSVNLTENHSESGELFHGQDGVFRQTKNRHISTAIHIRSDGSGMFFPNPFAHLPIADSSSIFLGAERAKVNIA